ncbi:hypothetical protein [Sedimentitalea sp.]|uniref:hypothetical protein n=1 Tax=Sedimentitalea sp. TaxID=2048915 RepID=UPI00329981E8
MIVSDPRLNAFSALLLREDDELVGALWAVGQSDVKAAAGALMVEVAYRAAGVCRVVDDAEAARHDSSNRSRA